MSLAGRPKEEAEIAKYSCKLYQKSMKAAKILIDYMEDGKNGKEPELDLSLDFDVDMNRINQKMDALILGE